MKKDHGLNCQNQQLYCNLEKYHSSSDPTWRHFCKQSTSSIMPVSSSFENIYKVLQLIITSNICFFRKLFEIVKLS